MGNAGCPTLLDAAVLFRKIGGRSAWLWAFAGGGLTLDRIRPSRTHEVTVEVLGEDFAGVLVRIRLRRSSGSPYPGRRLPNQLSGNPRARQWRTPPYGLPRAGTRGNSPAKPSVDRVT